MNLIFQELSQKHDRDSFDCETDPLNQYLKKFARQNQEKGFSLAVVALDAPHPKKILGYYTVSSGQIDFSDLPTELRKGLPKYPVPVMRIGRLGVDKTIKGKGIGKELLMDALRRALDASERIGIYAVVVDAKDENAKSFYKKYGFIELLDKPRVLFIALDTVRDASE